MRIAIAGVSHETNTYCAAPTVRGDFYEIRGEKLLGTATQDSDIGGAVRACLAADVEPVPILFAGAQPSGTIDYDTYQDFKTEILDGLAAAGDLDGVVLCLHGAGVVDGIDDLEGDLARAVREQVGERMPVTASFDLHGNVTQAMADALNGVFACHHYPHIDMHDRAAEAVDLILRMHRDKIRPVVRITRAPMLLPTTTTFEGIGQERLATMLAREAEDKVIDVSWFHGFPYTDVGHVGTYVAVTTDADPALAERVGHELAEDLWADRAAFTPESLSAAEAVAAAMAYPWTNESGPVVIHETSDNCGGGAPGDGTHLLRAMVEAQLPAACFGFVVDPVTARQAHKAGVGAEIEVAIGGLTDELHGEPLKAAAYVKALHDGRIILQAMFKGTPLNLGPMARLKLRGTDIEVIVASRRSQTFDPEPFLALGMDVNRYRYVALKSSNHFRAGFQDLAATIITADPPGLTTHHIEVFPRQKSREALWPLDPAAVFDAAGD
ncbi:MAG: M81 family metallopeptidase [Pseudomonadota bacterium]